MAHAQHRPRRGLVIGTLLLAATAALGILFLQWRDIRFETDDLRINPRAQIRNDRTYELVLWDRRVPAPWATESYEQAIRTALQQFHDEHPNIRVSLILLDPGEGSNPLTAALTRGSPPDVYGGPAPHPAQETWQIPVTPYLPQPAPDQGTIYHPAALAGLTRDEEVWGWPRWMDWRVWAGNGTLLKSLGLDVQSVVSTGWTWGRYVDWARNARQGNVRYPAVINSDDVGLLRQLLLNAGAPRVTDEGGNLLWTVDQVAAATAFLQSWRDNGLLPQSMAEMSRERISLFLQDRSPVIAPVNPWVMQHLHRRADDPVVLLPIPHQAQANRIAPVEVSAYTVFRQERYRGDDHTRAAMKLAEFLARKMGDWAGTQVGLLPAATASLTEWEAEGPLEPTNRTFLLAYLQQAPPPGSDLAGPIPAAAVEEVLQPLWDRFWDQEVSPDTFAAQVLERLGPLVPPGDNETGTP